MIIEFFKFRVKYDEFNDLIFYGISTKSINRFIIYGTLEGKTLYKTKQIIRTLTYNFDWYISKKEIKESKNVEILKTIQIEVGGYLKELIIDSIQHYFYFLTDKK